jgi:hypothetical protein
MRIGTQLIRVHVGEAMPALSLRYPAKYVSLPSTIYIPVQEASIYSGDLNRIGSFSTDLEGPGTWSSSPSLATVSARLRINSDIIIMKI